jgi:hypothetical protein
VEVGGSRSRSLSIKPTFLEGMQECKCLCACFRFERWAFRWELRELPCYLIFAIYDDDEETQ